VKLPRRARWQFFGFCILAIGALALHLYGSAITLAILAVLIVYITRDGRDI
jgi:hypothetical protein